MEQKKSNLIIILMGVIIIILAVLCVLFATGTINLKSNELSNDVENQEVEEIDNDDIESEETDNETVVCNYTNEIIEEKVLNYFIQENGYLALNGEKYDVASALEEDDIYMVRISHLENDHVTTDEIYYVSCINLKGNLSSNPEEIDFNN